jgi:hypothetical protein
MIDIFIPVGGRLPFRIGNAGMVPVKMNVSVMSFQYSSDYVLNFWYFKLYTCCFQQEQRKEQSTNNNHNDSIHLV